MQDFVEAAKRAASNAADRLVLEADRVRRVNARQREVDLARRERGTLLEQMASVVLDLDSQGAPISPEPLRALIARLRTLDGEIAAGLAEIQSLKAESLLGLATGAASSASANSGQGQPALGARSAGPAGRDISCPTCGHSVRGNASFCPTCGTRLR